MSKIFEILAPIGALLAIAAAGCSKPEDKFVGHYTGQMQFSQKTQVDLAKAPPQLAAQLKDQLGGLKMDLELKKDKTYTATATIPSSQTPSTNVSTGTWAFEDNKLTLTDLNETVNGKPSPLTDKKPQVLVPAADGNSLTADMSGNPQAAQFGSLVFRKS